MARKRQKPIEYLEPDEVASLIQAGSRRAPTGIRNRAIVALLAYSAIRVGELVALMPRDLDLDGKKLNVRRGKGHKQRFPMFHPNALPYLELWLARRTELGFNGQQPLFCTLKGGALSTRYIRQMLQRHAERAGIEKRVHPHGLRHAAAVYAALNGVSMPIIQEWLGHSSLAVTGEYFSGLPSPQAAAAIHNLDWPTA